MTDKPDIEMADAEPSEDAVRLMHRLRTYGETTSFAITDRMAALQIDLFAAKRSEPLREALGIALAELKRCASHVAEQRDVERAQDALEQAWPDIEDRCEGRFNSLIITIATAFAEVRAEERERCVRNCENRDFDAYINPGSAEACAYTIAAAIRARGDGE